MKNTYQKILLLVVSWIWMAISHAGTGTDYSALSNNLAVSPGLQAKAQGYDLLSGKVIQNIPLVKGNIPFTMKYHASLRLDGEAGPNLYQELNEGGIADWSNEYSGNIVTSTGTTGVQTFLIELPNSSEKIIITKDQGKFKRLYYTGTGQFEAKTFYSENLKDISFNQVGDALIIVKDGIKYTAGISTGLSSAFGSTTIPSYIFKFTSIEYQDGRKLNLSYDNGFNLIKVQDNRNNTLNVLRDYKRIGASSQSYLERKLITGVELVSGNSVQTSYITYQEAQVNSIINPSITETRYTVSSINSIVAGSFSFQYEDQSRGYWIQYVLNNTSRNITNVNEGNYPILKRVLDQNNNSLREYEYSNVWQISGNGTNWFTVYTTQITSYSTLNNQKIQKSISMYDDIKGQFLNRFTINGQDQTLDLSMTPINLPNNYNESDLTLMMASTGIMTVSGSYAGLVSGSTPIRSVKFNPFTHRLISMTDYNGNISDFTYDNINRLTQKSIASNNVDSQVTTYNYTTLSDGGSNNYPTPNEIITDSKKVINTINPSGWIVQQVISYPKGGSTKTIVYTYNTDLTKGDFGLISNIDGPRSDVNDNISFTYDAFGNKATATQVVNNSSVVTKYLNYNAFAQPERIIYPSGIVDKYVYNTDGTIQSTVTGDGSDTGNVVGPVTSYTYDYLKRKKSEINPDNEATTYEYDGLGRLIKTTNPDGVISTQSYFDNNVVQSSVGATATYNEINLLGLISKTRDGTNENNYWKAFSYDANGNTIQTQTAHGIVEKWTFDALNRNITYSDGAGHTSTKTYDKENNLTSAKDSVNSGSSPFSYVSSTLVKDEINNDYATKSYTYNQADQVTSKIHGTRTCMYSNIDTLGRTGSIACYSENDADPAYAYNYQYNYDSTRFGRLDSVNTNTSFGVNTQYSYDYLDRVIGKSQTNKSIATWGGSNASLNVGYTYSNAGKVTAITMPSGRVIDYIYDGNKARLASIKIAGNPFISNISYDDLGQLNSWNIENTSAKYSIVYDQNKTGMVKSLGFNNKLNNTLYSAMYDYDRDGRITSITKPNNVLDKFGYTLLNGVLLETRVINSVNDYGIVNTYGKNGNPFIRNITGNTNYPSKSNLFTISANSNKISQYTRQGTTPQVANYLSTGELRFAPFLSGYDGNGQMRYSGGASSQYYMAYNHKNERTVRSINTSGNWYTGAVQYIYDESSNLIGEYSADGTPLIEYIWMGGTPVAAVYGNGNSSKIYVIVSDHNNTPRMLVDNATNNAVWSWDSTAFGVGQPTGSVKFNLRFSGQYYDELTGLHYNLNRYYNPEIGRYMEPDPIGLEGGSNPYVYAGNNPISNIDPSGLDCIGGSCGSSSEQFMYDWWPGYKFGTGLYNSFNAGYLNFSFWEGLDGLSLIGLNGAKGLQYADDSVDVAKAVATRTQNLPKTEIPKAYSVAYETTLKSTSYPGVSRGKHFQEANESLLIAMEKNTDFAGMMKDMGVNLSRTKTGLAPREPAAGWTWHHGQLPGQVQLVPRWQHYSGNKVFWEMLHPNNKGGYSIWGK